MLEQFTHTGSYMLSMQCKSFPNSYTSKHGRHSKAPSDIAERTLATFLIPGCVGRGVRLGSENSSGAGGAVVAGGVWKSGNLEIWESGNLEIWGPGNPQIWRSGDLEIQKFGVQQNPKIKILKIQIRSAQNVGKSWISRKKSSWPHLGPSEAMFSIDRKKYEKM